MSKKEESDMLADLTRYAFAQNCMTFAGAFTAVLDSGAVKNGVIPPSYIANALYGTIGAIAHKIPQEVWDEMCKTKPCGAEGCVCHNSMQEFMEHMTKVRSDAIEAVARHKGEQSHAE